MAKTDRDMRVFGIYKRRTDQNAELMGRRVNWVPLRPMKSMSDPKPAIKFLNPSKAPRRLEPTGKKPE